MKHALITGGSRGIGLAIARKFLMSNVNVTIISRTEANLLQSVEQLSSLKSKEKISATIDHAVCDISSLEDVTRTCQQLLSECTSNRSRTIDYLVNSAGITHNQLLVSLSPENIKTQLDTNVFGPICLTKLILKQMMRQRSGSIVNIGSVVGSNGNIGQTVYSASKASLVGFTKSLAKEVGPRGIRVNLLAPGFIETDMTQNSLSAEQIEAIRAKIVLNRLGHAQDIAEAAYFLATSSYITGSILAVDGGLGLGF